MSGRPVRVLHVEDDLLQQRFVRAMLEQLPDLEPTIATASSEDAAIAAFTEGFDAVLLDYQLEQGDGLSCLKRLRQIDAHVPILAVSGAATPDVAAELLEAGADDFLDKASLTPELIDRSLKMALARHQAWKERVGVVATEDLTEAFAPLANEFVRALTPELLDRVDAFVDRARGNRLTFTQIQQIYETTAARLEAEGASNRARDALRPLVLDLLARLYGIDSTVPESP
jgi:CheY-like chemotaxis protein